MIYGSSVPFTPSGRLLEITINSTWGDKDIVALMGLEF